MERDLGGATISGWWGDRLPEAAEGRCGKLRVRGSHREMFGAGSTGGDRAGVGSGRNPATSPCSLGGKHQPVRGRASTGRGVGFQKPRQPPPRVEFPLIRRRKDRERHRRQTATLRPCRTVVVLPSCGEPQTVRSGRLLSTAIRGSSRNRTAPWQCSFGLTSSFRHGVQSFRSARSRSRCGSLTMTR